MRPTWFGRKRHVNSFLVRVFILIIIRNFFSSNFLYNSLGFLFSVALIRELWRTCIRFLVVANSVCVLLGFDLSVEGILGFVRDCRFLRH